MPDRVIDFIMSVMFLSHHCDYCLLLDLDLDFLGLLLIIQLLQRVLLLLYPVLVLLLRLGVTIVDV